MEPISRDFRTILIQNVCLSVTNLRCVCFYQLYMQKFQLKGERFGGGAGFFGRGRRGGFRGGLSRQGDTCYKCGGTGHWAMDCKGPGNRQ